MGEPENLARRRAAGWLELKEIVDPFDTRPLLCERVETANGLFPSDLGPPKKGMRP
ncbi:MAG: hypothetical protein HXY45_15295 [Syntrophaceae bacterium]|nr:hypothetical protein [Syntrophaceae bacterium]